MGHQHASPLPARPGRPSKAPATSALSIRPPRHPSKRTGTLNQLGGENQRNSREPSRGLTAIYLRALPSVVPGGRLLKRSAVPTDLLSPMTPSPTSLSYLCPQASCYQCSQPPQGLSTLEVQNANCPAWQRPCTLGLPATPLWVMATGSLRPQIPRLPCSVPAYMWPASATGPLHLLPSWPEHSHPLLPRGPVSKCSQKSTVIV